MFVGPCGHKLFGFIMRMIEDHESMLEEKTLSDLLFLVISLVPG